MRAWHWWVVLCGVLFSQIVVAIVLAISGEIGVGFPSRDISVKRDFVAEFDSMTRGVFENTAMVGYSPHEQMSRTRSDGRTLPGVFKSETDAVSFIRTRIAKGTEVHADESGAWNAPHGRFIMKRINHQKPTASWAPARMRPSRFSAAFVAARSGIITISQAST